MSISGIGSSLLIVVSQAIAPGDVQSLIQMVEGERGRLPDTPQVAPAKPQSAPAKPPQAVPAKPAPVCKTTNLDKVLAALIRFRGAITGSSASSTIPGWDTPKIRTYELPLNDAILEAGIKDLGFPSRTGQRTRLRGEEKLAGGDGGVWVTGRQIVGGWTNKGEINGAIAKVKAMIDAQCKRS